MADCLEYEPVSTADSGLTGISEQLDTITDTLEQILAQGQAAGQSKDGMVIAVCAFPLTDPPQQFLVQVIYDELTNAWTYRRTSGAAVVEGVDFVVCPTAQDYELTTTCYEAIANGTGYITGDRLDKTVLYRASPGGVTFVEQIWVNIRSGAALASPPASADILPCEPLSISVQQQILCDDNGPFIRGYVYENGAFAAFADRDLGGTLYSPVGAVGVCDRPTPPLSTLTDRRVLAANTTPPNYSFAVAGVRCLTIYNKTSADLEINGVGFAEPWQAFIPSGGTYSEGDTLYTGSFQITFLGNVGDGSPSVIFNYRV